MLRFLLHWVLLSTVVLCLAAPVLAEDEDDRGSRGRGAEHRSERADENSNAQWSDDATRGQDRAEERRHDHGDEDDDRKDGKDEKDEREKKGKKDKKGKKK